MLQCLFIHSPLRTKAALQSCCRTASANGRGSAKSSSSSIRRDKIRREAAAGIQQQQPASSSTNAMHHVEAGAHHARRWPTCDVMVALAPGTAAQRASSTPSHEDLRSERPRPLPKAKKASDIARQESRGCQTY